MEETLAGIGALSPEDAEAWKRLVAGFGAEAPHLFGLLGCAASKRAVASLAYKTLRAKGLGGTLDMGRFLIASPRQWLEETFSHGHVRAMLGAWGMHLDFAPDVAGGALFPYLEGMAGQAFGMVLGQGGADTVVKALTAAITARGGTVECGASVRRILHDGSAASGIELDDGRQIRARKAVIAGVAPRALTKLAGPIAPCLRRAMSRFAHAPGTMMIHLAMDGLPEWRAGAELKTYAYVHIAPSLDQMARTYQQAKAGLLPDEPVLVVGQPTVFDASRAPPASTSSGCRCGWRPGRSGATQRARYRRRAGKPPPNPSPNASSTFSKPMHRGTRARILGRRIVTPLELEADNPNLVGGDQVCGSHHLSQHFLFRPARGHADGSTPIRNLFMTGAAVWPGGGTGAGSGYLLARKLAGH